EPVLQVAVLNGLIRLRDIVARRALVRHIDPSYFRDGQALAIEPASREEQRLLAHYKALWVLRVDGDLAALVIGQRWRTMQDLLHLHHYRPLRRRERFQR